jgi:hypothetical protein
MQKVFGTHFRAGFQLTAGHFANLSSITWPEVAMQFEPKKDLHPLRPGLNSYFLKIWLCGQLIHASDTKYDVVLRTRPDLVQAVRFELVRVTCESHLPSPEFNPP